MVPEQDTTDHAPAHWHDRRHFTDGFAGQSWFWTPEWQRAEREADEDIREGNVKTFDSAEDLIDDLHADYKSVPLKPSFVIRGQFRDAGRMKPTPYPDEDGSPQVCMICECPLGDNPYRFSEPRNIGISDHRDALPQYRPPRRFGCCRRCADVAIYDVICQMERNAV